MKIRPSWLISHIFFLWVKHVNLVNLYILKSLWIVPEVKINPTWLVVCLHFLSKMGARVYGFRSNFFRDFVRMSARRMRQKNQHDEAATSIFQLYCRRTFVIELYCFVLIYNFLCCVSYQPDLARKQSTYILSGLKFVTVKPTMEALTWNWVSAVYAMVALFPNILHCHV